jgi:hypothetical protein
MIQGQPGQKGSRDPSEPIKAGHSGTSYQEGGP